MNFLSGLLSLPKIWKKEAPEISILPAENHSTSNPPYTNNSSQIILDADHMHELMPEEQIPRSSKQVVSI